MARNAVEDRLRAWVELVGDLLLDPASSFPMQVILDELATTFEAVVTWHWMEPDGSYGFRMRDPIAGWPQPGQMDDWSRVFASHPLIRWFGCTGDLSAMTMERVPEHMADPRAVDVLRDGLPPLFNQQLALPYRHAGMAHRGFLLSKAGRDFPDEDLVLAQRIQPLLSLLIRQWAILERRGAGGRESACRPPVVVDPAELGFTGRQLAVLQLLAEGCTAVTIGRRLGISPRTVEAHLYRLYRKLGVHDRLMAVLAAREHGLIAPPDPVMPPHADTPAEHPEGARRPSVGSDPLRVAAWRPGVGQFQGVGTLW